MKTRLILKPGQQGTKSLAKKYGDAPNYSSPLTGRGWVRGGPEQLHSDMMLSCGSG